MRKPKPKDRNSELIVLIREGIGKIDSLTEMARLESQRADRLMRETLEIRNIVSGRDASGRSKVYLKGVRRDQFFAAVGIQEEKPGLSPWKCAVVACAKVPPTAENGGFDEESLYRYIRTKPEYFRWRRGRNAVKYPMA